MKTIPIAAACAAALLLTACATAPGVDPSRGLPSQVLQNLQNCKRTYQASVGGFGVPGGSLYIECNPPAASPAGQPGGAGAPVAGAAPAAVERIPMSRRAT